MRYDAAIIGAGADGLAAAVMLVRSGLKVIVLERNERPGGRCITREFHPGFQASPFCDELPPIPPEIFWSLGLARLGAVFVPASVSTALWRDCAKSLAGNAGLFRAQSAATIRAALERSEKDILPQRKASFWTRSQPVRDAWPGEAWAARSLSDLLSGGISDAGARALAVAEALGPRAAHPDLAGSALHLLAPPSGSGLVAGGLQRLADSLLAAAQGGGAEILCGLEVTDIRRHGGKATGLRLADGTEIAARAVVSTLDLKRTFLSLFAWNDLPPEVGNRVGSFRMAGGTARLLFALDSLPERPAFATGDLFAGPIHIAPEDSQFGTAYAAWRAGTIAPHLPVILRAISATDPRCCPTGAAVMTATVACVPGCLFDGSWTNEKRDALREQVLVSIERVLPGMSARIKACELIVPPDIEEALGCTDGDLWGGDIASDQMLGFRPWLDCAAPRTPIDGLYLAGPSTAAGILGTCVSGVFAARAVMADLKARRLK
ncbi:MAG: NAD(P)/FAD-dependent oxidoreductase [Proteobacteria bacterium]|nr:NAD(P)/FAD-dependent oxidoreductase [Pseudomonadota bacterium]